MTNHTLYRVFLLRLWREQEQPNPGSAPLRIVLEEPGNGRRTSFPSLEALLQHLRDEVHTRDGGPSKEAGT